MCLCTKTGILMEEHATTKNDSVFSLFLPFFSSLHQAALNVLRIWLYALSEWSPNFLAMSMNLGHCIRTYTALCIEHFEFGHKRELQTRMNHVAHSLFLIYIISAAFVWQIELFVIFLCNLNGTICSIENLTSFMTGKNALGFIGMKRQLNLIEYQNLWFLDYWLSNRNEQ